MMEKLISQVWSLLGLLTVLQNLLPAPAWFYHSIQDFFTPHSYFEIPEFNDLYRQVSLYLNSINPSSTCSRLSLSRSKSSTAISYSVAPNHTVHDAFRGHRLSWTHHVQDSIHENRSFTLKLPKPNQTLLSPYLDHVALRAAEFDHVLRERRLFTNNGHASFDSGWSSVTFRHPSTFQTLALDPELKNQLLEDLTAFADGKDFYKKTGRAWKRGYLLHGPPGSGKSSLIAAMANFLCYDVYDLELSKVKDNSELRALLMQTANRSIIVIEDIDCSIDLTGDRLTKSRIDERKRRRSGDVDGEENGSNVTLSGLLNFTDGLWSCCGEERVIVFTTNHRDTVDPALLRCGRMDVHVSLGTCGLHAFKTLVRNYLGLDSHVMFDVVESCMRSGGALTPAQIGEILLRNRRDADVALKAVVSAMQAKIFGADVDDGAKSPDNFLGAWPEKFDGKKKERDSKVRLRSLTKSDSGRRGA